MGYSFFTKINILVQYDTLKDLTTIVTPFGKYRYNVLPMGLKCFPDFAQKSMENIIHNVNNAEVYIDHIGAFSDTWKLEAPHETAAHKWIHSQ